MQGTLPWPGGIAPNVDTVLTLQLKPGGSTARSDHLLRTLPTATTVRLRGVLSVSGATLRVTEPALCFNIPSSFPFLPCSPEEASLVPARDKGAPSLSWKKPNPVPQPGFSGPLWTRGALPGLLQQ